MAMIQRPKIFVEHTGVRAAMTQRGTHRPPYGYNFSLDVGDDEATVLAHRATLAGQLGFAPERMATQHQVHGDTVAVVREGYEPGKSDALVTFDPGWLLAVSVADCAPVLIYDPIAGVVAGIHSGWRGTAANIVGTTVNELRHLRESQPEDLIVYVGPAAGACCYEVGTDVADRFVRRHSREIGGGKYLFDNRGVVLQQLLDAGVRPSHIEMDPRCTICDGRLHSYRRDGPVSGRMFAVIGLAE